MTELCTSTYNPELTNFFIENQNCVSDGMYQFMSALYFNFPDVVKRELENGANVNHIFSCGNTPLHVACKGRQYSEIIRIVLNYKPLVNIRNGALETPLNLLIKNRYFEIDVLRKLLEMGADPNIPNRDGNIPLHYLSLYRVINPDHFKNCAALLIEHHSNLNFKNKKGYTPLYLAVHFGFQTFVDLLLANGALIYIENASNDTVVRMAFKNRRIFPGVFDIIIKEAMTLGYHRILLGEEHYEEFNTMKSLKIFEEQCDKKLIEFKRVKIASSNFSVYDVLTSSTHKLAKYLRNQEILKSLKNYDTLDFGILQKRFVQRLEKGLERMEALKRGHPYGYNIFGGLPVLCLDKIISFLSNEDLKNLKCAHYSPNK